MIHRSKMSDFFSERIIKRVKSFQISPILHSRRPFDEALDAKKIDRWRILVNDSVYFIHFNLPQLQRLFQPTCIFMGNKNIQKPAFQSGRKRELAFLRCCFHRMKLGIHFKFWLFSLFTKPNHMMLMSISMQKTSCFAWMNVQLVSVAIIRKSVCIAHSSLPSFP